MVTAASLANYYGASSTTSLTSSLLRADSNTLNNTISSLPLLNNNSTLFNDSVAATDTLTEFINLYVPNNNGLLSDLSSVLALNSAVKEQTITQSYAIEQYLYATEKNPYVDALQSNSSFQLSQII